MMLAVLLLLSPLQDRLPTVGDTVWIATRVPLPTRLILRPQTWDLGELGQVLGPPDVDYHADSATVRYPVSFWHAGAHSVSVPGPIVVSPEGRSDTLSARAVVIRIASVLPQGADKSTLAPRGPAPLVSQSTRSLLPLGIGLTLVGLGAGAVAFWLRRAADRRRAAGLAAPPVTGPDLPAILDAWARSGEIRTALDGWAHLIERELERHQEADRAAASPLLDAMAIAGFRRDQSPAELERLTALAKRWLSRKAA